MNDIVKTNPSNEMTFEDFKNQNGITFWWATDLMKMIGYTDMKTFHKVLDKTTKAFVSLNIPHYENIFPVTREVAGEEFQDFKMTRFACYITVMNGDPKKVEVAQAQAYFAQQTRNFEILIENNQEIDRLLIRDEISEGHKSLNSAAHQAGVVDYAKFTNAGYLGMYNMESWKLAKRRGVKKEKIMDGMGRWELAANLFRITQTEARIKSRNITGQNNLEDTHMQVGSEVRKIIIENTGKTPETLPQEKELPCVKKELKAGYRKMIKEDNLAKKK